MNKSRYTLTARREDLLEIFAEQFRFELFKGKNQTYIGYAAFFLIALSVALYNFLVHGDPALPLVICSIGVGYQALRIYQNYRGVLQNRMRIHTWIDETLTCRSHSLVMAEDHFLYLRDTQIFRYDLNCIERKIHNENVFELRLTNKNSLLVPAKSFAPAEYDQFISDVDGIIRRTSIPALPVSS